MQEYHYEVCIPKRFFKNGKGPTCTKICIAALFVVAKNWKLKRCPSIGEWLNKLQYMMVMEYHSMRNHEQAGKAYMN